MNENLKLIENLIYLIGNNYWRISLKNSNAFERNIGFIFKPIVVIVLLLILFRNILLVFINNNIFSKIMADFSHDWEFGIQFKLIEILCALFLLLMKLIAYYDNKNKEISKIISIELTQRKVDRKSIQIFKRIEIILKYNFILSGTQYFLLIINYSFELNILLITSIFWTIIYSILVTYVSYIYGSKLIAFILYCYRSKILLKY